MQATKTDVEQDDMRPVSDRPGEAVWVNSQGYWFYDETWSSRYGPWPTQGEAEENLSAYAETL